MPLSDDLGPVVAEGIAALEIPDPDTDSVREYTWYSSMRARVYPLETRAAAGDEIYDRWQKDPDNLFCLRLAGTHKTLLDRTDEYEEALRHPALTDTNTALGAYAESRRSKQRGSRAYWFEKSESLKDDLTPLNRAQLTITYTSLDKTAGRFQDGINRLIAELPAARLAGGHMMESVYWGAIRSRLAAADRLDDALHAAALSIAHAQITGVPIRILSTKISLATIIGQRGEFQKAINQLEQLAETAENQNLRWIVLRSLDKAAQFASEGGDYHRALKYDRHLLRYARQMNDNVNIPRSMASIAHDHNMTGNLDSTRVYLMQANEFVAKSDVEVNHVKMAELMAGYYCQVGNYAAAESMLVTALNTYDSRSGRYDEANLLLQLIPDALEVGRPDLAYEWLARVAKIKDSLAPRSQHVNYLADFELFSARLLADQGEYGMAYETLLRAKEAVQRSGGEGKVWQLESQTGEIALRRGDLAEAERAYTHCLDIALQGQDQRTLARSRFQLGQMYLDQGKLASAQELFTLLNSESTFGNAYRTGLTSLLLRGMTYLQDKQYEVAWQFFEDGINRLNPDSPADLVQRFHLYKGQALTGMNQYQEATREFEFVEKSFARDQLQNRFAELPVFATDIKRELKESRLLNKAASEDMNSPKMAFNSLEVAYPGLTKRLHESVTEGPVLVYFLGETQSWSWLLQNEKVTCKILPSRFDLQNLITPILIDLNLANREVDKELLSLLATTLLDDLAYSWPMGSTLTLVLDGALRSVPWAALPLPAAHQTVLERGPLQEFSAQVQAERPPNESTARSRPLTLLSIGCNRSGGSDLVALRQAEAEAKNISSQWKNGASKLLVGDEASWENALLEGLETAGVIHIASHADVRHGSARRSTLRLSNSNNTDSEQTTPVTMTAVSKLNLEAEIVYLSSCRAGYAQQSGAGQKGDFINTFLASGATTVIASTEWMDDDAARALAESFYENWHLHKDKAKALQIARLQVRETWSHPSYWAFMRLVSTN